MLKEKYHNKHYVTYKTKIYFFNLLRNSFIKIAVILKTRVLLLNCLKIFDNRCESFEN